MNPTSNSAPQILQAADAAALQRGAELLRAGKLVAFPTETVYGLGGDATNDAAVAAIYAAKGRPQFNPLIIHVADMSALDALIIWDDRARILAQQFWPGPLTLVLPRAPTSNISLLASAGLDSLAVRIPAHSATQELLRLTGRPIAGPSANASGKLSPTTPMHVAQSLGDKVDLILAGGKTRVGVESTVLSLIGETPTILRPGGISREDIENLIGPVMEASAAVDETAPASPGMMASHYAPELPLRVNANEVAATEAWLGFGPEIGHRHCAAKLNLSERGDVDEAAANLFAMLRQLDRPGLTGIAVAPIPMHGLGLAINDRLRRAAVRP